jgi:TNF receptor-associated protein 1
MNGELVSMDEYVSRCPPEQKSIYYLYAPTRQLALQSPYMEVFNKNKQEVLFIYTPIDDFVMTNLGEFEGRKLKNVDSSDLDLGDLKSDEKDKESEKDGDQSTSSAANSLNQTQADELCAWFKANLSTKVGECKTTDRLSSSPAVITGNESAAYRRIMRMVETSEGGLEASSMPLPKQTVEINPNHEIITGLFYLKDSDPDLAQVLAEQVFDNCLTAAGLLDDGRSMLPRLNDLLLCIVKSNIDKNGEKTDNQDVDEQK